MTTDRISSVWALGDYPKVAEEVAGELGTALVAAAGITPGQRVLDVGAGSGNAAIRAAAAGAEVVAADPTPELLEAGREDAAVRGLELDWVEASAEALPFADAAFDAVISCLGVMFAADHRAAADELVRVCRPGGTIGMVNWTPDGSIGAFFEVFARHAPELAAPPSPPPAAWGSEEYLRELLGDRVEWLELRRATLRLDRFADPRDLCDYYKANFGPTIATYAALAGDPDRLAELDGDFLAFATEHAHRDPNGTTTYEYEYLVAIARRADGRVL